MVRVVDGSWLGVCVLESEKLTVLLGGLGREHE